MFNNKPYENYKMLSKDGEFMAYTSQKRMNWYLDRDLAHSIDDKTYQLNFVTKNGNSDRAEYYQLELENKCVVCGVEEELTKHHVVPSQYRKFLPIEYKGRSSFDVVCVCNTCHNNYELEADKLNESLLAKHELEGYVKNMISIRKAFMALKYYKDRMPINKVNENVNKLEEFYGLPYEEIRLWDDIEVESPPKLLMDKITNIEDFIVMWRKHFLQHTNPKYLPKEWLDSVDKIFKV